MTEAKFEGWCIVELMGHRKLAGFARCEELFGRAMLRLDVPGEGEIVFATQYYGPESIYCLTPTTEAIARGVAQSARPAPVTRWELPEPLTPAADVAGDLGL